MSRTSRTSWISGFFCKLWMLIRRERFRSELDEEMAFHRAQSEKDWMDSGMSRKDARRAAARQFGNPEQLKESGTEIVSFWFESIAQDLRFALRQLRKNPGFTFTAVAVFGLGIAASTAIYGFVHEALVKPLPYRDPSTLVALYERIPVGDRYHLSEFDYYAWKQHNRVFASLDVYRPDRFTLKERGGVEEVSGALVSDGFFGTLGVTPVLGRDFRPGEDLPSAAQTVMLSYETWRKRFGADPRVVGSTVALDGDSFLVVGVLPREFHFAPVGRVEFWRTLHGLCQDNHECFPYYGVARLKQGVSADVALENISSIAQQIALQFPKSNRDRSANIIPLTDAILGDIRPTLITLLCGAGLLALIGFVNVSSLLLVRAECRRREIAVRGALGASHIRLIRQFAVEGFLLAASGCAVGLALTYGLLGVLAGQIPPNLLDNMPYLEGIHWNAHLLLFASAVSLLGGVLFSVGPALHLCLSDMQKGLMEGGRTSAGRGWRRMGASLVAIELAITVVLLVGAGLLAKSFYRLLHMDIGITADHLAVMHVAQLGPWDNEKRNLALERQIVAGISALPGVTSVGVSREPAVGSGEGYSHLFTHYRVAGRAYVGVGDEAFDQTVSVGYLETLRARLLHGRYFTDADNASRSGVAIINRTMARQEFPGEDAIGKRIISQYDPDHPSEIIGVVDDVKDGPLDMKPTAAVYNPFNQNPFNNFYVTLRTSQSEKAMLPSLVRAVHAIDPGLIADREESMADRIDNSQTAYLHRSAAWVVAGFAGLALLLGTVGLYGVISYSVSQRTREIGVRMALGAQRNSVYRLILTEAAWLAVFGVAGGMLCSAVATDLLRSMLFGVSRWDIGTMVSAAGVLLVSALLASYIPAHRAAAVDPVVALRSE
jgi:macrolide transport system ATP-binding/permease protein